MKFAAAEHIVIKLIGTIIATAAVLMWIRGLDVEIWRYALIIGSCGFFIALGQFYRLVRIHEPIASAATAIGLGNSLAHACAALTYMYLPYGWHGFDQHLATIDAFFGFTWSEYAIWLSNFPNLTYALSIIYSSSFNQILAVIIILSATSRITELHKFMLTLITGLLITVIIWSMFPSSTPLAFQTIPQDILAKLNLALNLPVAQELVLLSHQGITSFPPDTFQGLIGFPSFHTVMLVVTLYGLRNMKPMFGLFFIWNVGMLPAILLHGAHNLIDIFAGFAVAAFAVVIVEKWAKQQAAHQTKLNSSAPILS